ncbi:hypothetical protein [Engelhardtia mirabilis]|uniref:Uncharacterized protein n=1 Tax=Engelhardtia mirabilis TaxID=2528011 RepID=A0A518BFC1_9BACT|nr:hypothetical protein Pla133_07450 [Planctomycetes bacterium Pla133]QDV00006.1 hypothetical protein Pla86_07440 [Planctomycetes bacterium Pla86]
MTEVASQYTCSLLLDFPREAKKRENVVLTEEFGDSDLLAALKRDRAKLFSSNQAVYLALVQLSSRKGTLAVDLSEGAAAVQSKFREKARAFVKQCNEILALAGVKLVLERTADDKSETPTCIRWVWEGGQLVAKYNYGIGLEGLAGVMEGEKELTLHLSVRAEFNLAILD